jgi:putative ABC transport system permease protein
VLVPRRARRDLDLLSAWVALIAVAILLAFVIPRMVLGTVDQGAREAVAEAGSAADITVLTEVGDPDASLTLTAPGGLGDLAQGMVGRLPEEIARVVLTSTTSVISPEPLSTRVSPGAGTDAGTRRIDARLGMLGTDQQRLLTVVEGRLPVDAAEGGDLEVAVSQEVAETASLSVDSVLELPAAIAGQPPVPFSRIRVVGIVASNGAMPAPDAAACIPAWCDLPGFWQPSVADGSSSARAIDATLLAAPDDLEKAAALFIEPLEGSVRIRLQPGLFTQESLGRVITETGILSANSSGLTEGSSATVEVRTEFARALGLYESRAAAAVAQMSLMVAGVFGIAGAVLLVLSRLIVTRRAGELALERARGASIASVVARSLVETVVLAVVGVAIGVALATIWMPGPVLDAVPLTLVVAVAVLAPALHSVASVRTAWSGRRQPANRADRDRAESRGRQRRIVLELAVIALAAAALVSVRSRGLVSARTDGTDPLLACAPLLLAVAISIIVVRVFPPVVRAISALAARGRGALGVLGAAHARTALTAVPLIALTISVSLVVAGGLMVDTVRTGQVDASWEQVGADVRVDGSTSVADARSVAGRAGVDAASAVLVRSGVPIDGGASSVTATVLAVDHGYPDLVRNLPDALVPADGGAPLASLASDSDPDGPLAVVVDPSLADRLAKNGATMRYGDASIPIRMVGIADGAFASGYATPPTVWTDLDSLSARLGTELVPRTLLVIGDRADAVTAPSSDAADTLVLSRAASLAQRQQLALVSGVHRMMLLAAGVAALLAAVVLIAIAIAGARARARSSSLLRTMGMGRQFGWWLALSQLAPVVIAAVIGGTVSGVAILFVVGPALGFRILAGGARDPSLSVDAATVARVVIGVVGLLAFTLVVDGLAHARDRPGDVLRVGDTV